MSRNAKATAITTREVTFKHVGGGRPCTFAAGLRVVVTHTRRDGKMTVVVPGTQYSQIVYPHTITNIRPFPAKENPR